MRKVRNKNPAPVKNSGYSDGGASFKKKALQTWRPMHLSAKSDVEMNFETLRSRAHDLATNSPVGSAAVNTSATNVINTGLKLFPRPDGKLLNLSVEEIREWNKQTRREFELWAESKNCDFYRRNNFSDLQFTAYVSYLTDGDCFCLFRRKTPTKENPYSLRLQLVEGNRVSNPNSGINSVGVSPEVINPENGNRIINGIEIDKDGAICAVHISNKVPGEISTSGENLEWKRIKFFGTFGTQNILHIAHDMRPEQFRGIPYLAPVIETLKQMARYTGAELDSAIVQSYYSLFFTQSENLSSKDVYEITGDEENPDEPCVDASSFKLAPGTLAALPRGIDVKSVAATNAQSTFQTFMQELTTHCGAALGIPFEVLMKSFKSSYSASRAALLQASDEFRQRREWFARDFCQPIYEMFLSEAVATGRINAPGFFDDPLVKKAWCGAEWYAPNGRLLDVTKELEGAEARIRLGLSTFQREAAELCGTDFEENVEQLNAEKAIFNFVGNEGGDSDENLDEYDEPTEDDEVLEQDSR